MVYCFEVVRKKSAVIYGEGRGLVLHCAGFFVFGKDFLLYVITCFCVDGVNDISVISLFGFSAGHCDECRIISLDDFDVVNDEALVNCYRRNSFEFRAVVRSRFNASDSDVCDFHLLTPRLISTR